MKHISTRSRDYEQSSTYFRFSRSSLVNFFRFLPTSVAMISDVDVFEERDVVKVFDDVEAEVVAEEDFPETSIGSIVFLIFSDLQ